MDTSQHSLLLQSLLAQVVPALERALASHPAFSQPGHSFSSPPAPDAPIHAIISDLAAGSKCGPGSKEQQLLQEVVGTQLRKLLLGDPAEGSSVNATGEELSETSLQRTLAILDLDTLCLRNGLCTLTAPLDNIEELLEMLPVPACVQVWTYLEERADELTENLEPGKGKGLVLLRICNELLRRLSKPTRVHSRLAGRVLSLLAYVFPLGERSGTNFRGDFNVDNVTKFDEDWNDTPETPAGADVKNLLENARSPHFYKLFWDLQSFFSNPALLFQEMPDRYQPQAPPVEPSKDGDEEVVVTTSSDEGRAPLAMGFVIFKRNLAIVLDTLEAIGKRENELAGAAKAEEAAEGTTGVLKVEDVREGASTAALEFDPLDRLMKRRQAEDDGEARDSKKARTDGEDKEMEQFFPKYLTGRKVFEYELRDPFFRKHVLLQSLIILQFMLGVVPNRRKDNWPKVKNKALIAKLTNITGGSDDQRYGDEESTWVKQTWKRILQLTIAASSDGQIFNSTVLQALRHEPTWLRWKDENCPPIYRPPIDDAARVEAASRARKLIVPLQPFKYVMGTEALMDLWTGGLEVRRLDPSSQGPKVAGKHDRDIPVKAEGIQGNGDISRGEVQDDFDALEGDLPIPTLARYRQRIKAVEMRAQMRRKQLTNQAAAAAAAKETASTASDKGDATGGDGAPKVAAPAPPTPSLDSDAQLTSLAEAKYSLTWRGLRLARSTHLHLFPQMDIRSPDSIEQILEADKKEKEAAARRARGEPEPAAEVLAAGSDPAPSTVRQRPVEIVAEMPPPAIVEPAKSSSLSSVPDTPANGTPAPSAETLSASEVTQNQSQPEVTENAEASISAPQGPEANASIEGGEAEELGDGEDSVVAVESVGLRSGPSSPQPEDGTENRGDGDEEMTLL